jgi:RimJ/RimL family protein N-acetyltransferase
MIAEIVEGKTIVLKPLEESEAAKICEWRNHPDISRFFHRKHIEPDEYIKWMKEVASDHDQGLYAIIGKPDSRLLGTLAFKLNHDDKTGLTATLGIMIGDPAERGKGTGAEAMEVLADDLAARYGVCKTIVEVLPENTAAASFYQKLGYTTDLLVMSKKTNI